MLKGRFFSEFGFLFGILLATVVWLAFAAFARLELQGERFQRHFHDLVLFSVLLLRIFKVTFAENAHISWSSFGSFCASFFLFHLVH